MRRVARSISSRSVPAGVEYDVLAEKLPGRVRPRPNPNDRAWRSGAREPLSTPPERDRSFGSMAEQRTTNASGAPVASDEHSLTVGPNGPTALQDAYVVQKMQHFNRERVPERVVHAKGSAAHGFVATSST